MPTALRATLARNWWTLERFGLTPGKIPSRLAPRTVPRVLCVCIPKAGTHLLERALCLHPRLYRKLLPTVSESNLRKLGGIDAVLARLRPGQIAMAHLRFEAPYPAVLNKRRARGLFLVRDPRDIVVSQAFFVVKEKDHQLHRLFAALPDVRERIKLAIKGNEEADMPSIRQRLEYYAGWWDTDCLPVRFEDLVGPGGGGDQADQERTLRSIFEHLGLEAGGSLVRSVSDQLFSSSSPTFRKGSIGQWRNFFDEDISSLFQQETGDLLSRYGYA